MSLSSEKRSVNTEPNSASFRMPLRRHNAAIFASGTSMWATVMLIQV